MCREDLRIAKGKQGSKQFVAVVAPGTAIPADARRTALIISVTGKWGDDTGLALFQTDVARIFSLQFDSTNPFAIMTPVNGLHILRIEDYGQLITGPLVFDIVNTSGGAGAILTPVISEINDPPIFRSNAT